MILEWTVHSKPSMGILLRTEKHSGLGNSFLSCVVQIQFNYNDFSRESVTICIFCTTICFPKQLALLESVAEILDHKHPQETNWAIKNGLQVFGLASASVCDGQMKKASNGRLQSDRAIQGELEFSNIRKHTGLRIFEPQCNTIFGT